jgi:transposase
MNKHKSNPVKSVYRNQCIEIRTVFEKASSPRKVLCVALDYAKSKHVALCCDGLGDILKKPFSVENSTEGVEFLCKEIQATARRRKIKKDTIFLGGEDEPAYVANFVAALTRKGYLVLRVNAREAANQRENLLASTDNLDLLGISKCLLNRRASPASSADNQAPVYRDLRELSRQRHDYVRQRTAASNRIHAIADQLFPGFLIASKSGVTPFLTASLALMENRFSSTEFARRKQKSLSNTLRINRVRNPGETAFKLITLAKDALPPAPDRIATLQQSLRCLIELYRCLDASASLLRLQTAALLTTTPYVMLTSIPGISFVLASGIAGELGDPARLPSADSLSAYAGIVPAVTQTGGPDSSAVHLSTRARCNHLLKDWVVQGSQKIGLCGPPEHKERFLRRSANGQHAAYAGARTLLRLTRSLVTQETPYLPPTARRQGASPSDITEGFLTTWSKLVEKWRVIPGWQDMLTDENNPMGFWRRVVAEIHGIELSLQPVKPGKD